MKQGRFVGYFIRNQESNFYKSAIFTKVLQFVQTHANSCTMKEKQTRKGLRLLLTFENVNTIEKALHAIQSILV